MGPITENKGRQIFLPLIVFIIALAFRVGYVIQVKNGSPLYDSPVVDALLYDSWGWKIAQGDWLGGNRIFYDPPAYAYFLGIIYKLTGHSYLAPRLIQAIIGSFTCVFIFFLGRRLSGNKIMAGAIAGFIAAMYKPLIFYDAALLKASLTCFFVASLLLTLYKAIDKNCPWWWLVTGTVIGVLSMLRVNMLMFGMLGILGWVGMLVRDMAKNRNSFKADLKLAAAFMAGLVITLLPPAIRNYHVGGEFVIVSSYMGQNFYTGNNPYNMNDNYARVPFVRANPKYEENDFKARALMETHRKDMAPSEVSDYWFHKSLDFIKEEPLAFAGRIYKRTLLFFGEDEVPDTHNIYFEKRFSGILRLPLFNYAIVGSIGLAGMVFCLAGFHRLWPMYGFVVFYASSIIPFFVFARYRLPTVVPLIVFAGLAAGRLWEKRSQVKSIALFAVLVTFFSALVNLPKPNIMDLSDAYTNLGTMYYQKSRYDKAADEYKAALKIKPGDPMIMYFLASAMRMEGKHEEAVLIYHTIIEEAKKRPVDKVYVVNSHAGLGLIYEEKGEFMLARDEYQKVLILAPRMEDIRRRYNALIEKD